MIRSQSTAPWKEKVGLISVTEESAKCLSHYKQSNEYSHVPAQQFIAVVECEKRTNVSEGEELFKKIITYVTYVII